jgi:hypothetical protein
MINSRRGGSWGIQLMVEMIIADKTLVTKLEAKSSIGRQKGGWKDSNEL